MINLSENNVKKNMIMGAAFKGGSMILSYLYVPFILTYLGEVKYGVWATILNILSWINYFDIGIGNGLRNKLTECLVHEKSRDTVRKYVSSAYIMLGSIVLALTLVAVVVTSKVDWNSAFGVRNFDENLMHIMQICIFFVAVNFWLSLCKSILYAIQKNSIVNLLDVIQQLIMLLGVFGLITMKSRSIFHISLLYGLSNFLVISTCNIILCLKNRDFIPRVRYYSQNEAKETSSLGVLFFVSQIAALILFTTDNLLISHFIGPAEVTSYSIVNKVFSMGSAIFAVLVVPYWSKTSGAKAKGDYYAIHQSIRKMYNLLILGIIAVVVLGLVFKQVLFIWLGQELDYPDILVPMMGIYTIIYMWNTIYSQIANGLSLMKVVVPVAIVQAIVNIPLSLFFLFEFNMGVVGVLLGTIMSTVISAVAVPVFVHRELGKKMKENEMDE